MPYGILTTPAATFIDRWNLSHQPPEQSLHGLADLIPEALHVLNRQPVAGVVRMIRQGGQIGIVMSGRGFDKQH